MSNIKKEKLLLNICKIMNIINHNKISFSFELIIFHQTIIWMTKLRIQMRVILHILSRLFQNFLRDLLKEAKKINDVSEDKLIEYTDTMVKKNLPLLITWHRVSLLTQTDWYMNMESDKLEVYLCLLSWFGSTVNPIYYYTSAPSKLIKHV